MKGMHEKHLGNRPEAIRQLRMAGEFATDSAMPHLLLGQMLEEDGSIDEALLVYRAALRVDPNSDEARYMYDRLERSTRVSSVPTDP